MLLNKLFFFKEAKHIILKKTTQAPLAQGVSKEVKVSKRYNKTIHKIPQSS